MAEKNTNTTIAQNKKALHDYFVIESFEAGIELVGTEVKSLRQGKCNLKDAWCSIVEGELFVNGMHIIPYDHGNLFNRDLKIYFAFSAGVFAVNGHFCIVALEESDRLAFI